MKKVTLVVVAIVLLAVGGAAQDAAEIIRRSVEANAADWQAAPGYDYFERDVQPGGGTKTYKDLMILGSQYQQLVQVNRKPLSHEEQTQEENKLQATIAQRQSESPQQRDERIARYEKDRRRNRLLMEQLTKALNFKLVGEKKLASRAVYVLTATPRPDYEPPNNEAKVLTGMEGKLWIDKQTFQWVKVEARVIQPVSIEGFLAQVEPGTRFELEKTQVAENIWLPKHFAMKANARVVFLFHHKSEADETYYGYQKAASMDVTTKK